MSMLKTAAIVSTQWLKKQLTNDAKRKLLVLDSTWSPMMSGEQAYLSAHIPGAGFFDLDKCVHPLPNLARNLPEPDCFTNYAQSLGVSKDRHLVLYERSGMVSAARAWWTFRALGHPQVSVLNGGLSKWAEEGNEIEEGGLPHPETGDFTIEMQEDIICRFEKLRDMLKQGQSIQIADSRAPANFTGVEPEPSGSTVKALQGMNQPIPKQMLRGHIPGATNFPAGELIDPETGCLEDTESLIEVFQSHGIDLSKPLVTMCYNGNVASLLALAAAVCGKEDAAVYYGSWTEWGQRSHPQFAVRSDTSSGKAGG